MDDDKYRRNRKTVFYKYGMDIAILSAFEMIIVSMELLDNLKLNENSSEIIKISTNKCKNLLDGQ
jgi:geranylgeranyl pyrophosphate synthase